MNERTSELFNYFVSVQSRFLETLRRLALMDTPSGDRDLLDAFAAHYIRLLRPHCDKSSLIAGPAGARVRAEKGRGERTLLILAHMDTVWPVDADIKPALAEEAGLLRGPGVFDMKGGLCMALFAFEALGELGLELSDRRIVLLATPDEESGSPTSRRAIEREARQAAAVFVPEPPLPGGKLKMRRKGCGDFRLEVRGKESHAGVNPEDGVNAIHELALQIGRLAAMNDPGRGINVNVGTVRGGLRANVIPSRAWAEIDFRAIRLSDLEETVERIRNLGPFTPGAELVFEGGINRPPMEGTPESMALARAAREIAAELGADLQTGLTGGGSDGSFAAALGIPTVDGLGLEGSGAHTQDEHIIIESIPRRATIFTELLLRA